MLEPSSGGEALGEEDGDEVEMREERQQWRKKSDDVNVHVQMLNGHLKMELVGRRSLVTYVKRD